MVLENAGIHGHISRTIFKRGLRMDVEFHCNFGGTGSGRGYSGEICRNGDDREHSVVVLFPFWGWGFASVPD
jgi:hypothetical protein